MTTKDKIIKGYQEREKKLTTHLLVIHMEQENIIQLMETPTKLMTVGAVLGGRIELIKAMFRELNQDKEYNKRWMKCLEKINAEQKKNFEQQKNRKLYDQPSYMG